MSVSESKVRYMEKYRKANLRYIPIRFRKVEDEKMLEWLDGKESKSQYIKELILKDMELNGVKNEQ